MTCWKCNTFFCWKCKKTLLRDDPYLHYRDPQSVCFNMLYHGLLFENDNDEELENFENLLDDEGDYEDLYLLDDDDVVYFEVDA